MIPSIEQRVFDNLDNALENEYNFTSWEPSLVVHDILTYADYDFEKELEEDGQKLFDEVLEAVKKWQQKQKDRS